MMLINLRRSRNLSPLILMFNQISMMLINLMRPKNLNVPILISRIIRIALQHDNAEITGLMNLNEANIVYLVGV